MRVFLSAVLLFFGLKIWAQPVNYKIDSSHASILFKVPHLGFSNVYGLIPGPEGTLKFDEAKPENSSIEVSVNADQINTHDKKRDEHLRGPDFFNVKQFPKIVLKSKSVKKVSDKKFEVVADLTMLGQTKPLTFTFDLMKSGKDPWGNQRIGGEAKFSIKRSDYKMTYMNKPNELGDVVEMVVSMEGIKL